MRTLAITAGVFVLGCWATVVASAQENDEPEVLPPPPGEVSPRRERLAPQPAVPITREEITLYGTKPLGRDVPMHIRAMFESNARGEARRLAAIDNQKYILNHVAWMNGLPSPFVGPQGQPSLDYVYSGLGRSGFAGDGLVFEPWPYVPGDIWGYPFYDAVESPVGHRITWRGPNAYTYEPVYAGELKQAAPIVEESWPLFEEGEQPIDPIAPADAEPAAQRRVQALFAQEQFIDAAAALRDVIQDAPREAWDAGNPAQQLAAGDVTRALRSLEAAVAADRNSADLRLLLAWQYHLLGHQGAAIHQLDQALRIDADDSEAQALRDAFAAE